jgi:hypothetical protein
MKWCQIIKARDNFNFYQSGKPNVDCFSM